MYSNGYDDRCERRKPPTVNGISGKIANRRPWPRRWAAAWPPSSWVRKTHRRCNRTWAAWSSVPGRCCDDGDGSLAAISAGETATTFYC